MEGGLRYRRRMITCGSCGRDSPFGTRLCGGCGAALPAGGFPLGPSYAGGLGQVCPRCDTFAELDTTVCGRCAYAFTPAGEASAPGGWERPPQAQADVPVGHATVPEPFPAPSFGALASQTLSDVSTAATFDARKTDPVSRTAGEAAPSAGLAAASAAAVAASETVRPVASTTTVPSVPGDLLDPFLDIPGLTLAPPPSTVSASTAMPLQGSAFPEPELARPARPAANDGPVPLAGKAGLRGAVREVPPVPGTALKDGLPVARDPRGVSSPSLALGSGTREGTTYRSKHTTADNVRAPANGAPAAGTPVAPVMPTAAELGGSSTAPSLQANPGSPSLIPAGELPIAQYVANGGELAAAASVPRPAPFVAPRAAAAEASQPCSQCGAAVPAGFLFCGRCGSKIAPAAVASPAALANTQYFSPLPQAARARLVLIKGEGLDGIAYQLSARDHGAGRSQGMILFPDDRFLSPRHANFQSRDGRLFLRDEGSVNGVFVRIRTPVELHDGDTFLCGEELLRFEQLALPRAAEMTSDDGTVFYGTPLRDGVGCRVVQVLLGGRMGMVFVPTKPQVLIGRDSCDLSFPRDRFISGRHTKLELQGRAFVLSDLGSKNGTYLRIREERELLDGDYVFLGQQLFRVELQAA